MLPFTNHSFARRVFYFKKYLLRSWRRVMMGIVYLWLLLSQALAADGTDYLATSKDQVVKNFGADSTLMHYIYFAEVIVALISFVKVKNPLLLTGVLVLLIIAPVLIKVALGTS